MSVWLQAKLDQLERELLELNGNSERLQRSHAELVELQLVLETAGSFFDDAQHRASSSAFDSRPSLAEGGNLVSCATGAQRSCWFPHVQCWLCLCICVLVYMRHNLVCSRLWKLCVHNQLLTQ